MTVLNLVAATVNAETAGSLPRSAGVYDIEVALDANRRGRFTLARPAGIDSAQPRPLVVVLHYAGQPTRYYGRPLVEQLFEPAWRELGALYVAPESLDGQWSSAANEAFVLNLVDTLQNEYAVDRARIVVAGYSMGAIGSWHFITHYPERFSAAVPVAGFPRAEVGCAVPVYTLATESDEIFDYQNMSTAVEALRQRGCAIEFARVDARGHYDVNGFATALAAVAPWLYNVWRTPPHRGE